MGGEDERLGLNSANGTAQQMEIDARVGLHRSRDIRDQDDPTRFGGAASVDQSHGIASGAMRSAQRRANVCRPCGSVSLGATPSAQGWNEGKLLDEALQQSEFLGSQGREFPIVQALDFAHGSEGAGLGGFSVRIDGTWRRAGSVAACIRFVATFTDRWSDIPARCFRSRSLLVSSVIRSQFTKINETAEYLPKDLVVRSELLAGCRQRDSTEPIQVGNVCGFGEQYRGSEPGAAFRCDGDPRPVQKVTEGSADGREVRLATVRQPRPGLLRVRGLGLPGT